LQYTTQQEQNLDRYLWQLEERDLVYEERAVPELEYSFWHVLTQETAYNTILSRRRREFHRKVAEGYEALYASRIDEYYEELAYHYSRSDDSQKALHYLVKAGDKSKEAFANEEAIEYYNQALKLTDDVETVPPCRSLLGHIYQSLGEIYFPLANHEEALECCRKALEYTTDKKRRARIYGIMGWMYQRERKLDLASEHLNAGITELGDDTESPEMARICIPLFYVTKRTRNMEEAIEIAQHGLKIVEGTTHHFEIHELYNCLIPRSYNDIARGLGPIDKAFATARKSVEVAQRSGNSYLIAHSTFWLGMVHWLNHEDDIAIKLEREAIDIYQKIGYNFGIGQAFAWLSVIYTKRSDWDTAIEHLERCLEISGHPWNRRITFYLAWTYLQKDDAEKAIEICKQALEVAEISNSSYFAQSLGIMEETFAVMGKREEFIPYCTKLREEKGEAVRGLRLTQWYFEPKELSGLFTQTAFMDEFDGTTLGSEWEWNNPRDNSSYGGNFDAPRLLQEISGDFAAEVKLKAASDDLPSVGGLLVWRDRDNYIRFERGMHLKNEIGLSGSVQGEWNYFGRGMLASDTFYLRLERIGDRFSAYCSGDGQNWLTCGEVNFPAQDPIQVGIHAIGSVGLRGIHMAAATRFDYFRVLRRTL
jgi:tetratricopeptide (TPR) repeat protein/regulation of enolase protein 1 (concanavalin A-like superfamily)